MNKKYRIYTVGALISQISRKGYTYGYNRHACLNVLRKTERVVAAVESDEVALEEDITVDLQTSRRSLKTTKAS